MKLFLFYTKVIQIIKLYHITKIYQFVPDMIVRKLITIIIKLPNRIIHKTISGFQIGENVSFVCFFSMHNTNFNWYHKLCKFIYKHGIIWNMCLFV